MENPVCALVEKQFVTTFPGAVGFQLVGRGFTIHRKGRQGCPRLVGTGHRGPSGHSRLTASTVGPSVPGAHVTGKLRPAGPRCVWWGVGCTPPSHCPPHGAAERTGVRRTCLGPQSWEEGS